MFFSENSYEEKKIAQFFAIFWVNYFFLQKFFFSKMFILFSKSFMAKFCFLANFFGNNFIFVEIFVGQNFFWQFLQMSLWLLVYVQDCPRNLPLKFDQNRVSNSWDIPNMDKCHQDKCCPDKCHFNNCILLKITSNYP